MKKLTLLILVFLMFSKIIYGQSLKPDTIIKSVHNNYITKVSDHSIAVNNTNNVLQNRKQKFKNTNDYIEKTDHAALLKVFNQVFSKARMMQLLPENGMLITYYIDTQGKVLEVSFYLLKNNTLLTAKEIEQLETGIKDNITFKIQPADKKGRDFFDYAQFVKYKSVLNGTVQ